MCSPFPFELCVCAISIITIPDIVPASCIYNTVTMLNWVVGMWPTNCVSTVTLVQMC